MARFVFIKGKWVNKSLVLKTWLDKNTIKLYGVNNIKFMELKFENEELAKKEFHDLMVKLDW